MPYAFQLVVLEYFTEHYDKKLYQWLVFRHPV